MFHLALTIKRGYEGMLIAIPPEHWTPWQQADPGAVAERLVQLARRIDPKQLATNKRNPKRAQPKAYVDGKIIRAHVATARVLAQAGK